MDCSSFFTFCQSVYEHALAARCYAVGHRKGDNQTAQEDDAQFSRFQDYRSDNYHEFAGLMRIDSALAADEFGRRLLICCTWMVCAPMRLPPPISQDGFQRFVPEASYCFTIFPFEAAQAAPIVACGNSGRR